MGLQKIISIGNMLVEVMRVDLDQPFDQVGTFMGPFPSGDTPIYVDTVARLGHPSGFIGAVGSDDFGTCLLDRFKRDGVDTSNIISLPTRTTGVAFVAYFTGGQRKFIYHWRHAAAGCLAPEHVNRAYIRDARWLHLTGCNLAVTESARLACIQAMDFLPDNACLSFDVNIRTELLSIEKIRELCQPVIKRANVLLPSLGEAAMLTGEANDELGCQKWVTEGKLVVLKQGAKGCRIYSSTDVIDVPGFPVDEVDPTGAGDAFCAAFTVALLEGMSLHQAGQFANAVGAFAVKRLGPMEGIPTRNEVEEFLQANSTKRN